MALISDARELKGYIFKNPQSLENSMFILAHAPYCARNIDPRTEDGKIYMDVLNQMFQKHEYTIPFYYIGYLKFNSRNISAADCKGFLRSMCNDLDRITKWFSINGMCTAEDPDYLKNITPKMTDYIKTFIAGVRKKQLECGANESAMLNYAPIIPYSYNMSRCQEIIENQEAFVVLEEIVAQYAEVVESTKRFKLLSTIAMQNTNEIIEWIDLPFHQWKCPMDIFTTITLNRPMVSNDTLRYLAYIWFLNKTSLLTPDDLLTQYRDFLTFKNHSINPLKRDEFKNVFESMCKYETGSLEDMMTTEAWSALAEDSQEMVNKFLEKVPKSDINDATYDLDALLSEFYTMRHVETNDYTNQFFLAEIPGIIINSYNYLNDNIMICEINSEWLVIPYVDIACDYQIRLIGINKDNEIKIWEDLNDINDLSHQ